MHLKPGKVRVVERPRCDLLGEGPLWCASEHALFWCDILGRRLNRLSLDDDAVTEWAMPEEIGWLIERRAAPGFVAGLASGIHALTLDPFALKPLVKLETAKPDNRLNDAKADAHGRIWAGTMVRGGARADAAFFRIDPDLTVAQIDDGYRIANGPAISPDGAWLCHSDSALGHVYRYALGPDGSIGPRQVFITFEKGWGSPDGMTFDTEGGLWIAHWGAGRISRFDRRGRMEQSVALPASQITSCAFAGAQLDRLFVTSAADGVDEPLGGALFEVDVGRRGLLPEKFGG